MSINLSAENEVARAEGGIVFLLAPGTKRERRCFAKKITKIPKTENYFTQTYPDGRTEIVYYWEDMETVTYENKTYLILSSTRTGPAWR
jgi:hypothetical protein